MKLIKHILSRYTAFVWAVLKPLGAWGVFAIAALDGAALGLPMDLVIAGYVYANPQRFLLYVIMASAGSALGSLVIYAIGREGGKELLQKRMSPERFEKFHSTFEKHPFWSVMFPAMLPPPTPFKLVALTAAASGMTLSHYLLAILAGRFVRFLALAILTLIFGPEFIQVSGALLSKHGYWFLAGIAAVAIIWLVLRAVKSKPTTSDSESGKALQDPPQTV